MSSNLTIRTVNNNDTADILAIYKPEVETGTASWEYEVPSLEEMARRIEKNIADGYPWLIAEQNGRLLGYAYASSFRPRIGYRFCVENSVYLAPEARRTGIGRKLMEALISRCTELGFRQMIAVIGDSANTPSIKFHQSLGFKDAGVIKSAGFKNGLWLDSINMQLQLGEGDSSLPS